LSRQVELLDGTVVDSASDAWRAECEARAVLEMPTRRQRQEYLANVGKRRGQGEQQRLERIALALWDGGRRPDPGEC